MKLDFLKLRLQYFNFFDNDKALKCSEKKNIKNQNH